MISVCVPSRGRPSRFKEMLTSLRATAVNEVEIVSVLDADDPTLHDYPGADVFYLIVEPGQVQSDLWNVAWRVASGDIAMLGGDDAVFRTPGWDLEVEAAFRLWPDRIGMVYTSNATPENRPEFPFVSREWIEAAGTFTPPQFRSWFADQWIWDVAAMVRRRQYLPEVVIEHVCPAYGKHETDELYEQAKKLRMAQRPADLYRRLEGERLRQAERLREAMTGEYPWDGRAFT